MNYIELSNNQQRVYIDMLQLYETYKDAEKELARYSGSMRWKKSNGQEYLFRARGSKGYGKSLGVRSPETEGIKDRFTEDKAVATERINVLADKVEEQARFCKAALINRVPNIVTGVLRVLDNQKLLSNNLFVVGTYALYAYETMAGVRFDTGITATTDIDFLWHKSKRLKVSADISAEGFMGALRKVDKSFRRVKREYKAVNQEGFEVDLIQREPKNPFISNGDDHIGGSDDLVAVGVNSQKWMEAAKKINAVIIGMDGYPSPISVPDPRVFVLHKLWMSQDISRDSKKRRRDKAQAIAVADVIINHLPDYPFSEKDLQLLPKEVIALSKNEKEMPAGFKFSP